MKLDTQFEALGFTLLPKKEEDCVQFENLFFGCIVELCDDGSWAIIALPCDRERYLLTNTELEIIEQAMQQLGHDKGF